MATPLDRRLEGAATPLFAPLGLGVVLRLEQLDHAAFMADPALASFSLRSAQEVLQADAIAVAFDTWAEAEAAGRTLARAGDGSVSRPADPLTTPVDPAAVIDAAPVAVTAALTRRAREEMADGVSVVGTMTAPATLLKRLYGTARGPAPVAAAAQLSSKMVDLLCGAGVAAIVLLEDEPPEPALFGQFDAAFNLAGYYQVPVLYLSRTALSAQAGEAARGAGARWAIGPGDADGLVAAIPLGAFAADGDFGADWKRGLPDTVRLFLSAWEIPAETAAETILRVRNIVVG